MHQQTRLSNKRTNETKCVQVCELLPQLMSEDPNSDGGSAFPDNMAADPALYSELLTEKVTNQSSLVMHASILASFHP